MPSNIVLKTTKYYSEFLRYAEMSKWQHINCNLGTVPYVDTPYDDDLIKNVYLYDVCERKYAGFSQIVLDLFYDLKDHPYKDKMTFDRSIINSSFDGVRHKWDLREWLYVFFVHRLTGSGINYSQSPSGYYNSILPSFCQANNMEDMIEIVKARTSPMFTSIGYQIAPFPKPVAPYKTGGVYFMCEILPKIIHDFLLPQLTILKVSFRYLMNILAFANKHFNCRVFWFQYAAVLADIADFFPEFVDRNTPFFYGKNAIECLNYMAERPSGVSQDEYLDIIMKKLADDVDGYQYNVEDIACDAIRWVENYINTKAHYSHLDLDKVWSSHDIIDHPYGRQKPMLHLGLVDTFNGKPHPSDDKILKDANVSIEEYKRIVKL